MVIKIVVHVHFKWVENHHRFSYFSISHQTYTTNFTLDYHNSITQKQPYLKIREEYHTRWWSTILETHTTKTTRDHEDDGIMETEDFWGRELIRRHRVLCFIFDRSCVMIYVSFIEVNLGYYVLGRVYIL